MNIAIDGPAGAGKSSIAKLVAKELNYVYVDTGAMFRTMAYYLLNHNIDPNDENLVNENCDKINIEIRYESGRQLIFLNGTDVTTDIRKEEVGNAASVVAKYTKVRTKLLDLQREIAATTDVIMDGRDIGTVVLPDAECKIYLTASVKVRTIRRYKELLDKGEICDIKKIESDIIKRDNQDMEREVAPLRQADDAIYLDTSDMTIDDVVQKIKELASEARG